ncbi:response regulator [Pelagibacterium sediminicola]|uniref:response regulator n=1 Tax=Pelagibacterium sediminicola TaxID=2248761 RepID=UPI000E3216AF|nr:response regulator [Pelagibacterium sediminicola]
MTDPAEDDAPIFALVDDHIHSARLFARTLRRTGAFVRVRWMGNAGRALRSFERLLSNRGPGTPDMIVVDLKASSAANENFLTRIASQARAAGIPVAVMATDLDHDKRQRLLSAGATAAFDRHHEHDAYRRQVERISSYWVRETGTWPIRA